MYQQKEPIAVVIKEPPQNNENLATEKLKNGQQHC